MENKTVLVLGCDEGGRVRSASASFSSYTGLSGAKLYGRRIDEFAKDITESRLRLQLSDGTARDFDTSTCDLDVHEGSEVHSILVLSQRNDALSRTGADAVSLSERESQILEFVADGFRVATIARRLFISPSTVRNHLSAIFKKVGVANQAQLLERLKQS